MGALAQLPTGLESGFLFMLTATMLDLVLNAVADSAILTGSNIRIYAICGIHALLIVAYYAVFVSLLMKAFLFRVGLFRILRKQLPSVTITPVYFLFLCGVRAFQIVREMCQGGGVSSGHWCKRTSCVCCGGVKEGLVHVVWVASYGVQLVLACSSLSMSFRLAHVM